MSFSGRCREVVVDGGSAVLCLDITLGCINGVIYLKDIAASSASIIWINWASGSKQMSSLCVPLAFVLCELAKTRFA